VLSDESVISLSLRIETIVEWIGVEIVERIRIVAVYIMVWRYMPRFMAFGSSVASFSVWFVAGKVSRILLADSPKPHADSQHCITDGRLVVDVVEDTRRHWKGGQTCAVGV
jgi:hypothetical protein